jgi:hypothetical protein
MSVNLSQSSECDRIALFMDLDAVNRYPTFLVDIGDLFQSIARSPVRERRVRSLDQHQATCQSGASSGEAHKANA